MAVQFRFKNIISSAEFNSRYADILLPSILRGFYFEKGTEDFDLTITYKGDQSNALIMQGGVRIEELELLEDVLEITPNTFPYNRFDNVYAHYIYGNQYTEVTYIVDEGTGMDPNELLPQDEYMLLGRVEIFPNQTLETAIFHYPNRGIHLPDVAHPLHFKEKVIFEKGADVIGGEGGENGLVTEKMLYDTVFPYTKVESSEPIEESNLFKKSAFFRVDGTKCAESELRNPDSENLFQEIFVTYFATDGFTVLRTEVIKLVYDEFGRIISKSKE